MKEEFKCDNCKKPISDSDFMGTKNRNHCPFCLWSKHLDEKEAGDRKSVCQGEMEPVALTFKKEGVDKYGKSKTGEIMLVHECLKCGKISINRIAGDDDSREITKLFEKSHDKEYNKREMLGKISIRILEEDDREEMGKQLFGKKVE